MFDVIAALTSEVGVEQSEAKAIASRFLTHLTHAVQERFGDAAAEELQTHLPHWQEWKASEPLVSPVNPVHYDAAIGIDARLSEILGHLDIDPVKAGVALPPLVSYLKANLPPTLLPQVYSVAPFLSTVAPEFHPGTPPPQPEMGL